MEDLRHSDLRGVLDLLERLGTADDLDEFAENLVSGLGALIPADFHAYNEVNPTLRRTFWIDEPKAEASLPEAQTILERHMHENPLVAYTSRTRDGRAHTWSDLVSQRRIRTTELWNELFRPFGVRHQMVALLPARTPLLVGIVLNRCGRDFSVRDRALLDLLRPHVAAAYRNLQARMTLSALERAPGGAVVVLGALGEPLAFGVDARKLFGDAGDAGSDTLPERLLTWAREARARAPLPAAPLVLADADRTVEARFVAPSVVALCVLRERVDAASLESLGLTRRQREVLALLTEGLTNKEIAARIGTRPATVKKHLEAIYGRLGVRTRTAAAAAALAARRSTATAA